MRPPFFFLSLLIPLLLGSGYLIVENVAFLQLEERLLYASRKGQAAIEKKQRKEAFIHKHANADPYFLDTQIEQLSFLGKERTKILYLMQYPSLTEKKALRERLETLASLNNRLSFAEKDIRSLGNIKEVEERQRHPVQIDETDLQKLCSILEGVPVHSFKPISGMPQLMICDIKIRKSAKSPYLEISDLNLLRRDWINE
ncbi:MAG: hypothetical protein HY861_03040 [Chlamydiia bacterium]|nr:hypothetical protein [Chlamydiia bacterium]